MRSTPLLVMVLFSTMAFADRIDTGWHWGFWKVETGEELFWGAKHTSYPATYLFDEDPMTAWVFSGLLPQDVERHSKGSTEEKKSWRDQIAEEEKSSGSRFWITLQNAWPVTVDGIEIMNGYNKSPEVFGKNRRVTQLEIWRGERWIDPLGKEKPLKTARLPDEMGWHRITFRATKLRAGESFTIRLTGFAGAESQDIALSGLRLLKNGKPIDFHMPEIVDFTMGSDCG